MDNLQRLRDQIEAVDDASCELHDSEQVGILEGLVAELRARLIILRAFKPGDLVGVWSHQHPPHDNLGRFRGYVWEVLEVNNYSIKTTAAEDGRYPEDFYKVTVSEDGVWTITP